MTKLFTALKILLLFLSTEISAQELRLVSLTPAITQTLDALGGGPYLVGADQASEREGMPVVADYRQINVEAIVRLSPSHVIAWQDSLKPGVQAQLEHFDIEVLVSQTHSIERWLGSTRSIALDLGLDARPIQFWEEEIKRLEATYAHRAPVPTAWIFWDRPIMVAGNMGFTAEVMGICGLQNVFEDIDSVTATIDPEQLLRRSPRALIGDVETIDPTLWDRSPFIWTPPSNSLSQPGPTLPEGILALCEALDPIRSSL